MKSHHDIPWFNPRQMDDATVIALSTGRETLLKEFFQAARKRINHPSAGTHWLVPGPRGAGKSFFLRLVQATFQKVLDGAATFVLLPEELPNVRAPHEWLREVERMLPGKEKNQGNVASWRPSEEASAWESALQSLLSAFPGQLLVIGVENFDKLIEKAFNNDVRASRLRNLMENEPRIMLLATAVAGDFDEDYDKRLFLQFERHPLRRWDEEDHRIYLERRALLIDKIPTPQQLARIDAYSRYTGGSARIAAVLAAAILDDQDPVHASSDLTATLDRMSDYYRSMIEKLPANSGNLFDALIRGGEPASQMELAERVGALQSDISKAFAWLVDYGYVINEAAPGKKAHSYRVTDRLFVQFYRMRYLEPDQPCQLTILADLLAAMIEFKDKWIYAEGYLLNGQSAEAELMAGLACQERGVDISMLPSELRQASGLVSLGKEWSWLARFQIGTDFTAQNFWLEAFQRFRTDAEMKKAYDAVNALAKVVNRGEHKGADLASLTEASLSLSPVEKYAILAAMTDPTFSDRQWQEMVDVFEEEAEEFAKLQPTEGPSIRDLEQKRQVKDKNFPLASSLTELSSRKLDGLSHLADIPLTETTNWASRAVLLWIGHDQPAEASSAFSTLIKGVLKLLQSPWKPAEALAAISPLRQALSKLTSIEEEELHAILARCLHALDRNEEALSEYEKARSLALKNDRSKQATWYQERFAWQLGALWRTEEAIAAHQIAVHERQSQAEQESIAWNQGQIARHHLRRGRSADAWRVIDDSIYHEPTNDTQMIQQLGDAVWDHIQNHSVAQSFAFALELLSNLASRPRFDPNAILRVLWIDMIEMGVPLLLLKDLLDEVPLVFSELKPDATELIKVLDAWLEYLAFGNSERTAHLRTLNPDLANTLQVLGKELSPQAQNRYWLDDVLFDR
jgi:predicted transcriptional regulator